MKESNHRIIKMQDKIIIEYIKVPLHKFTFKPKPLRAWVEHNVEGRALNLFAGEIKLLCCEVRVDSNPDRPADYHMDALEFLLSKVDTNFNTIILDPPYGYRKSMEMYQGHIASPFKLLKDAIVDILPMGGIVITFGYHSVSMGTSRGFKQEKILLMSHGGAIHDTIAVVERKIEKCTISLNREEIA